MESLDTDATHVTGRFGTWGGILADVERYDPGSLDMVLDQHSKAVALITELQTILSVDQFMLVMERHQIPDEGQFGKDTGPSKKTWWNCINSVCLEELVRSFLWFRTELRRHPVIQHQRFSRLELFLSTITQNGYETAFRFLSTKCIDDCCIPYNIRQRIIEVAKTGRVSFYEYAIQFWRAHDRCGIARYFEYDYEVGALGHAPTVEMARAVLKSVREDCRLHCIEMVLDSDYDNNVVLHVAVVEYNFTPSQICAALAPSHKRSANALSWFVSGCRDGSLALDLDGVLAAFTERAILEDDAGFVSLCRQHGQNLPLSGMKMVPRSTWVLQSVLKFTALECFKDEQWCHATFLYFTRRANSLQALEEFLQKRLSVPENVLGSILERIIQFGQPFDHKPLFRLLFKYGFRLTEELMELINQHKNELRQWWLHGMLTDHYTRPKRVWRKKN